MFATTFSSQGNKAVGTIVGSASPSISPACAATTKFVPTHQLRTPTCAFCCPPRDCCYQSPPRQRVRWCHVCGTYWPDPLHERGSTARTRRQRRFPRSYIVGSVDVEHGHCTTTRDVIIAACSPYIQWCPSCTLTVIRSCAHTTPPR